MLSLIILYSTLLYSTLLYSTLILQDDDYAISRKVKKVLSQGLIPVLCVGESRWAIH